MRTIQGSGIAQGALPGHLRFGRSLPGITKFSVPLPGLGPLGMPLLTPNANRYPGVDFYTVVAREFAQRLHPALPATKFWGFVDAENPAGARYRGGVIIARRGRPVKMKITNRLPDSHILPVDKTVIPADIGDRVDRTSVGIHGSLAPWTPEGGPRAWFSNPANGGFEHGSNFLNGGPAQGSAMYSWHNQQSARLAWYYDHAYGLAGLNSYAGLATAYYLTDDAESFLIQSGILPDIPPCPLGIPLVIEDKTFWDPQSDPEYPVRNVLPGDLWYPWQYESSRWEIGPDGAPPIPSAVPEAFLDVNLVNGAPYPALKVAPRRYRFRILNASQARFYNLQLYVADGSPDGITLQVAPESTEAGSLLLIPANPPGPRIIQIGNEGGFLPAPVVLNDPPLPLGYDLSRKFSDPRYGTPSRYNLLLAPGERADVLVDFRGFEGKGIILYNDAPAPFSRGDVRYDYCNSLLNPNPARTTPGHGPDTRIVMRFDVSAAGSVRELSFAQTLNALKVSLPVTCFLTHPAPFLNASAKVKTIEDGFDRYGRLRRKILVGNGDDDLLPDAAEIASGGPAQTWQIYNLTGDTQPLHFNLVNVRIVRREAWRFNSDGSPCLPLSAIPGSARPPDPNEKGWKETVRLNPGEIVTVAMKFDQPLASPAA